jgi:hypothetical protein
MACQQLGCALGVRCVVAGRRVGGHAHQFLQEMHFFVEVASIQASSCCSGVVMVAQVVW